MAQKKKTIKAWAVVQNNALVPHSNPFAPLIAFPVFREKESAQIFSKYAWFEDRHINKKPDIKVVPCEITIK